ncbi:MAG: hypothetical protein JXM79_08655 [Sedimentisphaerales bacterium]|nr:hypothetical protein [Sedimentisphaerales bacterium]
MRKIHVRGAICLVLVLVVIGVFKIPRPNRPKKDITILRTGQKEEKEGGFHVEAGVLEASNNITTTTSSSTSGHAKFVAESVIIQSESDHVLIDKVCRFVQKKMVEFPYVERVEYWPFGVEMEDPLSRADIIVVVDARKISEGGFGMDHKLEADISCYVGTDPVQKNHHSTYHNSPPLIDFSMDNHLEHRSLFKGFESGRAKYKQQSENIGQQFVQAITKQFDQWIEKHGLLPELPEYMFGGEVTEVEFEFLKKRNARRLHHGVGLLTNCRIVWSYEDERANDAVFREVRELLREKGWRGGDQLDIESKHKRESFTMDKGDERLQIFRMRGRSDIGGILYGDAESLEKKLPMVVDYVSLFTNEQMNDVLGKLFASEADIDTKLIFENLASDERVKQLLLDSVESQQVKTMDGYLLVGRYYADKELISKAKDALMMARALGRADREHNPAENEIKELAKKIGNESLIKTDIGIEHYQRAGFVDISTIDDGAVYERAVDEPLMFYTVLKEKEGDKETDIKTVVIRICKLAGTEDEYEVEKITKQRNTSSHGKNGLAGSIFIDDSLGQKDSLRLDVEKREAGKFKLTVRKK